MALVWSEKTFLIMLVLLNGSLKTMLYIFYFTFLSLEIMLFNIESLTHEGYCVVSKCGSSGKNKIIRVVKKAF